LTRKIALNSWFKLPWLGADVFQQLMRAGVKHDKQLGFKFTSATDKQRAISILRSALNEEVEIERVCFICDSPIGEADIESPTLCDRCINADNAYSLYVLKFQSLLDKLK
jgi:hypothetical protein